MSDQLGCSSITAGERRTSGDSAWVQVCSQVCPVPELRSLRSVPEVVSWGSGWRDPGEDRIKERRTSLLQYFLS